MQIQLRNVKKSYGKGSLQTVALNGIDLEIAEGELITIMGPSGSGKSTLLNLLGCIDKCTSGSYIFNGVNINECNSRTLAKIRNENFGFIFQSFNLIDEFNLIENISLPLTYKKGFKGSFKKKSMELLNRVGLIEHKGKRPNQLSGGQQQRVAIARALVGQPSIILADEPTGALDQKTGKEIMKMLLEINKNGKTVIIITHDLNIARQCKRVIYIQDGLIKESTDNILI